MTNKTIKTLGGWIAFAGAVSAILAAGTDDARTEARSRDEVSNPSSRELFKEDCASEKVTNTMTWAGALAMLTGAGLMVYGDKKKSR